MDKKKELREFSLVLELVVQSDGWILCVNYASPVNIGWNEIIKESQFSKYYSK